MKFYASRPEEDTFFPRTNLSTAQTKIEPKELPAVITNNESSTFQKSVPHALANAKKNISATTCSKPEATKLPMAKNTTAIFTNGLSNFLYPSTAKKTSIPQKIAKTNKER